MSSTRRGWRLPPPTELDAERRLRAVQRLAQSPSPTRTTHVGEAIHQARTENA